MSSAGLRNSNALVGLQLLPPPKKKNEGIHPLKVGTIFSKGDHLNQPSIFRGYSFVFEGVRLQIAGAFGGGNQLLLELSVFSFPFFRAIWSGCKGCRFFHIQPVLLLMEKNPANHLIFDMVVFSHYYIFTRFYTCIPAG